MKPKMKSYVYYAPLDEGVYFKGWSTEFIVKGKNLYPFIEQLVSCLDGNHTIEDIINGLDERKATFVKQIIEELMKRDMLTNQDMNQGTISEMEERIYLQTITYLEDRVAQARDEFIKFRNKTILLRGNGFGLKALLRSLLKLGLRNIFVSLESEDSSDYQELQKVVVNWKDNDQEVNVECVSGDEMKDGVFLHSTPIDLSIYINDHISSVHSIKSDMEQMNSYQIPHIIAGLIEGQCVIGPLTTEDSKHCWLCAYDTLSLHKEQDDLESYRDYPTRLIMIGNVVALEAFKYLTELPDFQLMHQVISVDEYLETSFHTIVPSPICQHVQTNKANEDIRTEDELKRVEDFIDSYTGIVQRIEPEKLWQIPYPHIKGVVKLPNRMSGQQIKIVSYGSDIEEARLNLIKKGLLIYTKSVFEYKHDMFRQSLVAWSSGFNQDEWMGKGILSSVWKRLHLNESEQAYYLLGDDSIRCTECKQHKRIVNMLSDHQVNIFYVDLPLSQSYGFLLFENEKFISQGKGRNQKEALIEALGQAISYYQLQHYEQTANVDSLESSPWSFPKSVHYSSNLFIPNDEILPTWSEWVQQAKNDIEMENMYLLAEQDENMLVFEKAGIMVGRIGVYRRGEEHDPCEKKLLSVEIT